MVPATVAPARIEARDHHRWVMCPNCGQRLAELVGERVVVKAGECKITMPASNLPELTCHRCGAASAVGEV